MRRDPSAVFALFLALSSPALAHDESRDAAHAGIELHVGYAYDSCYIDLHDSLDDAAFRRFNREFASGYAFTSQSGPRTLGDDHVQLGLVVRSIGIDEASDAWNDTWTHPGEDHWLGPVDLPILQGRVRLTEQMDLEAMFSMGMANWYIGGVGLRHTLTQQGERMPVDLSLRETVQVVHAIDTWTLGTVGVEAVAGRTFPLGTPKITATPYLAAGLTAGLGGESDDDVDLARAAVVSPRATAGLDLALGPVRGGVEGSVSDVMQWSVSLGAAF
ncbi:MAG: hypothetical protein H6742_14385 [Alphaproteobacteria bacterium]|nr:hypothetical protein [Alphaproteobacteria bacterium]